MGLRGPHCAVFDDGRPHQGRAPAAADRLAESDDLDWKEQLPQPLREGRWDELTKDVAAMANTRGGLIIFGVRDATCELVGIDPDEVNIEQYAQWVRNHARRTCSQAMSQRLLARLRASRQGT
ncbi:ATP-binding protein [Streptomyces sp. NPDC047841]|uniref:AlbA family DNA-binding domain-containing protein n=1 Tax=Streptomyces sp. NPDC047841 TaxID=3154708 RepID=UPI003455FFA1